MSRLSEDLRERTKRYASSIIQFYVKLPNEREEVRVGTARSRSFDQVFADLDRRFPT
jgi:hypothetical protein